MKIHDLANKNFESKDDIVVDIAEAITEVDEIVTEKNRLVDENEELKKEVNSLKAKNLDLLAMIPSVVEDKPVVEDGEIITEEDIYF